MNDLRCALVAGGTGGIGEGIVRVLLEKGWIVHVPVRGGEHGDRLKAFVADIKTNRLHLHPCDLGVGAQVADLRKAISDETGPLDLVVVSVGSSYYGYSLHKIVRSDWDRLVSENLMTHFTIVHEFLGQFHTQNRGVYVTLTGPEADFVHPETGLMSVLAAGQKMMARVEALEATGTGVRVYSVTSRTPIATRARGEQSGPEWITPEELGLYTLALVEKKAPGAEESLHVLDSRSQLRRLLKLPD
ncbi:MAG TPA: SDR family oxidoreductase [Spirochaetia bacterium]|jgi:NAD(P)-dependent dehydrogenase (short-subunit alcohol dehydrogenase family)|nr:SDR family oxidoreductase [Spirochaetia bacterium]